MLKDILCTALAATPLGVGLVSILWWGCRHGWKKTLRWAFGAPTGVPWKEVPHGKGHETD